MFSEYYRLHTAEIVVCFLFLDVLHIKADWL